MAEKLKIVGYYFSSNEHVVDEIRIADPYIKDDNFRFDKITGALQERVFKSDGQTSDDYQFVCVLNPRGKIILTPELFGPLITHDPLFYIGDEKKGYGYTVIGLRKHLDQCLHGEVYCESPGRATELCFRFIASQGIARDWTHVITIQSGFPEILISVENWTNPER